MSNRLEINILLNYLYPREYVNKAGEKACNYTFGNTMGFKVSGNLKAMENIPELKPNALYTCTIVIGTYYDKEQNKYRDYHYVKSVSPYKK